MGKFIKSCLKRFQQANVYFIWMQKECNNGVFVYFLLITTAYNLWFIGMKKFRIIHQLIEKLMKKVVFVLLQTDVHHTHK